MRVIVQRTSQAEVRIDGQVVGQIGKGFLLLVGITDGDTPAEADYLAKKVAQMRIFEDADGKMNLSLHEVDGQILSISQFTLYADCRHGNRPSFIQAAQPEVAEPLYDYFNDVLRKQYGLHVETGRFGADMKVDFVNDGPVTIILDSVEIGNTKQQRYEALLPQVKAVISSETDDIANMANVAAMLHETFHFWWTGFYRVVGDELVLGPFQGPLACTRIPKGRGVCGTCWQTGKTQVVPNVALFPGHIACSSASRSEIVVPLRRRGEIIAVLDIDSEQLGTFDDIDRQYLEKLVKLFDR